MSVGWPNFVVCILRVSVLLAAAHPSSFDVMLGKKGSMLSCCPGHGWSTVIFFRQAHGDQWSRVLILVVFSDQPTGWSQMGETKDMLNHQWPGGSTIPWKLCEVVSVMHSVIISVISVIISVNSGKALSSLLSFILFGEPIFLTTKQFSICFYFLILNTRENANNLQNSDFLIQLKLQSLAV